MSKYFITIITAIAIILFIIFFYQINIINTKINSLAQEIYTTLDYDWKPLITGRYKDCQVKWFHKGEKINDYPNGWFSEADVGSFKKRCASEELKTISSKIYGDWE